MSAERYTVSQITNLIKEIVEGNFHNIWVEGEVDSARPSSTGHLYFTLKEKDKASLKCLIFKSTLKKLKKLPQDGKQILAFGSLSIYPPSGEYRLIVEYFQDAGIGDKFIEFQKAKEELKAKGYFSRKRPIPYNPKRIVLLTSTTGAAVRDIINIIKRRGFDTELLIYPITVQGESAKRSILTAIRQINSIKESVDVVVISRGGGSSEDLWVFNDKEIAENLFNIKFPTISAIGHQIDITLCDMVADLRVETPSAAAEVLTNWQFKARENLYNLKRILDTSINHTISAKKEKLKLFSPKSHYLRVNSIIVNHTMHIDKIAENISSNILHLLKTKEKRMLLLKEVIYKNNPSEKIKLTKQKINHLKESLPQFLNSLIHQKRNQLNRYSRIIAEYSLSEKINLFNQKIVFLNKAINRNSRQILNHKLSIIKMEKSRLNNLNPKNILKRGYSITFDENKKPILSVENIKKGQTITTLVGKGRIISTVKETIK
ncbi:exodeoxyribonuclease VII large subunit [Hippea maritima]|uniref:Exodeoxyribonuclease 7 large subunit n=1 Tax=Hippea maritima (strain ATCC 700847 / DSM 10411 / MH2) TaxID=760142 RepID=F2LX63_HIPMA|nr:exodeoxyribonuclease VII large subunit [Hippea maritima]AEA33121.1 Exodeoxyribonuclease 7 large subunit [Hippea maritima DSM 10411]